jgi:Holliday junction DNA helicase RuvA
MISHIRGAVLEVSDKYAIIDVSGIGYKLFCTNDTLSETKSGKTISLWTHLIVREDVMDLYGFTNKKDLNVFELLISISGIGPKTALNILNLISADSLINAIKAGSTSKLVKVSGIGRKTAEKIALELGDKLGSIQTTGKENSMSSDSDVIEALKALGYDTDDARNALKKIDKDITDTGAKVKAALKFLN